MGAWGASTHTEPQRKVNPLLNTLKEPLSKKKLICLKTSSEGTKFKILPTDGARACWQICLDRRQLGLVNEEGQIVDHGKIKKRGYSFRKLQNSLKTVL